MTERCVRSPLSVAAAGVHVMPFLNAPFDEATLALMTTALEISWIAVCLEVPGLLPSDHAEMERAILAAADSGERDFRRLQQQAMDALANRGVKSTTPVERRRRLRVV